VLRSAGFWGVCKFLTLERETGLEPATSSLGISVSIENTTPRRSWRSTQHERNLQFPKLPSQTAA
jgi:hypothetical protein